MKKPNIFIDENAGFCFGVTKAINTAEDFLKKDSLFCLGELLHNETEMNILKNKGLKVISYSNIENLSNSPILFRAHGEPKSTYDKVKKNNNVIIDATCPIVKQLQKNVIKSYNNGENIFIFGKESHPEIIGIVGNINNDAVVFNSLEELKKIELPESITLYSQTTLNPKKFNEVIEYLKSKNVKLNAIDSICNSVKKRLLTIEEFCLNHDLIIFISGKNSSNGKSLFRICESINKNSFHIASTEEIKREWFNENLNSVGISGATSTPKRLLNEVKDFILNLLNY
ncbi:MAG: 4-hydroxy-3-methylbut-2-enyl diphosphate reductase [Bacteroidales bacterium]